MIPDTFRPEPRCHVCRTDSIRELVNAMLARGSSYAQIVRALAADGTGELSLDSVRNHANRHFPVQSFAQATYREIVERRAAENQIDFVAGVGTALSPMAYLETVMAKAFERLVEDGTEVSVETGLRAAEKLQAVAGDYDRDRENAKNWALLGRVVDVVRNVVPASLQPEIQARLDGLDYVQPSQEAFDAGGDGDEEIAEVFDPGDGGDDDDEF
jgi:hypothetical protein